MSRLWRYGSVYSRTRDFIVGKINPWESRPLWFDVWTKHPPRRDPVLLERVPINPLGYRNRRHPDFNYNEPPKLVYKADHVRAQFRKDYIDSPISCLTSQQTVMPLSDRVACRMVERNYGDWDGIDVTSLRSNALYHRALRSVVCLLGFPYPFFPISPFFFSRERKGESIFLFERKKMNTQM